MPWGVLKNISLSFCLPLGLDRFLSRLAQALGRRTLMNLTTFFPVS